MKEVDWAKVERKAKRLLPRWQAGEVLTVKELEVLFGWACNKASDMVNAQRAHVSN